MCTTIVYGRTADILVWKVSKLYFHTQFKSHNIQVLTNTRLISTFSWQAADIY
jgi:hypothetical protein